MHLNCRRAYNCIEGNCKIHDQTITKQFFLPQNTDTKLEKNRLKLEQKYSYNPSENTFIFHLSFPSAQVKQTGS